MDVWADKGSRVHKLSSNDDDMELVLRILVKRLNEDGIVLIAIVMRNIWLRMNKFVFEKDFSSAHEIFTQAKTRISEYQQAQYR